jgi:hypothetical protein
LEVSLQHIARSLNGEVRGNQVAAPGPGHSAADRSLSVKISDSGEDIVVHSFAGDDPIECKKYVREKCGLQSFKPNGNRHSDQDLTRLIQEAIVAQQREPRSKPVATYNYEDRDGTLLYQVLRYEPKTFRQRRPNGNGGWIWKLEDRRVPYRWPELLRYLEGTVFVCEGEKDADNVAALALCATTIAGGKWTAECVEALAGRDVIILQDNDDPGRKKALETAGLLQGSAKTVRVVSLPGLPPSGDVSDWLDMGHSQEELVQACFDVPLWEPQAETAKLENKPASAAVVDAWADPDWSLLDTQRGSLPDFPLDVLSPQLQEVIERTSRGAGVTSAHVAVPLLGISSGLIGYSRRIKATASWVQPATCWTALVGYSGTGKTPGHNVTRRAAKEVERLRKKDEEKRKRDHETKEVAAKAAYDNWKRQVKEATETGLPPPEMPEAAVDPGKYVPVRLIVNDGTIERLAELLRARPQGIVLVRDELAALFLNMSRYSGGRDDEFWLEAWNGEPHTVERMGRMLSIDHLLIGVVGGMQPDKLIASFKGDHDGKYARVLFAWPDEPGWHGLNNDATEIDTDIFNIVTRILTLAEFTEEGDLIPRFISLDPEAAVEFAQFAQFAQQEKNAFEGREREWFAKATAHVLRLANTLTHVEWALTIDVTKPVAVDKVRTQAAIRLVRDYFWPHARACLRLIGLTERHADERRVLLWIRAKGKTEVSREEIRRDALSQRLDAKETTDLLKALSKSSWLREEITASGPQGGKPARKWLVNPKLLKDPIAQTALTAETPS